MAFSNVGSVENTASGTNQVDTVSVAVPALATDSVLYGFVMMHIASVALSLSSLTFDGSAVNIAATATNGTYLSVAWYVINPPDNASYDLVATWDQGGITHVTHFVTGWADAEAAVSLDDFDTGTGTGNPITITSTPTEDNSLVVSGSVSSANALGSPTTTDCTELQSHDSGGNCSIAAYSIETLSGAVTHTHTYSQSGTYAVTAISFYDASASQTPPTVALNSPADLATVTTATPQFLFTGTDTESDDIRYNIQITDNPDSFTGGAVVTTSYDP